MTAIAVFSLPTVSPAWASAHHSTPPTNGHSCAPLPGAVWGQPAWRTPGDVVVIDRGGWHHVGFYLGEKGPEAWGLLSATQGANREIKEWYFPSAGCAAVRRP